LEIENFPEHYDFVTEQWGEEQMIATVYYKSNLIEPKRKICIIFTDEHISQGQIEWLESQWLHPDFYHILCDLSE